VDLSSAAVSLLSARNNFEVNIATLKFADNMEQRVLDILA
jgi:hypothetical protein